MVKGFMEEKDFALEKYLKNINNINFLSLEEERLIIKRINKGQVRAKQLLYECNLKLVVSIVRKYVFDKSHMMDAITSGNKGLMKAVETFDVNKGYGFSVYAIPYIRSYVIDYLISSNLIMEENNIKRKGKC